MNVEQLYHQYIRRISSVEQMKLIALISRQLVVLSEPKKKNQRSLSELEGLGAEVWEGIDAQQYVDELRNEWDDSL